MIAQLLGQVFLREVPQHLIKAVMSGQLQTYGSVIRDVKSGRIAGFLQEAAPLAKMVTDPTAVAIGEATKVGLQAVGLMQGEVIRQGINRIEEGVYRIEEGLTEVRDTTRKIAQGVEHLGTAMTSLQALGVADLALGAVGVGVSVAGFAVVSAKIDRVKSAVDRVGDHLSAKIDEVLNDPVKGELDDLRAQAKAMDEGWRLADAAAERRWHDVAHEALKLQERFERRAAHLLVGQPGNAHQAEPLLDAYAMANGLRVAALGACDEVEAACEAGRDGSRGIARMTGGIGLADLVRFRLMQSNENPGTAAWEEARARAQQELQGETARLRNREAAVTTRAAPLPLLKDRGIRPRDWLRSAHEEQDASLLLTLLP